MPIFRVEKLSLSPIKEIKFGLEKEIQTLAEQNLDAVFGLQFVSTEFALHGLRIDTLAFDLETKAFVIIEYKRDKSFSVIDQGYAYLSLMLNNKADFILEYNERSKTNLKRDDVDWSQSRVIFVANSFTTYQRQAINFKDLPIELWESKKYDNGIILFNELRSPDSSESIKTISKSPEVEKIVNEVKKYSVDDLFRPGMENIRDLCESLRDKIFTLDSRIIESPQKHYIAYKIGSKNLVAQGIHKSKVTVDITRTEPKDLDDPKHKANLVKDSMKFFGQNITRIDVRDSSDVDYVFFLIEQAYQRQYA